MVAALNTIHVNYHRVIVSAEKINQKSLHYLLNICFAAFLGWSVWTEWTQCNANGERSRERKCLTTNPGPKECQGNEREIRYCEIPPPMSNGKYFFY